MSEDIKKESLLKDCRVSYPFLCLVWNVRRQAKIEKSAYSQWVQTKFKSIWIYNPSQQVLQKTNKTICFIWTFKIKLQYIFDT